MRFIAFLALFLAACDQAPEDTRTVKVTFVTDVMSVHKACGFDVMDSYGCAKVHGTSCEIVAIKPKGFDDGPAVKTLGHELLHCYWGPVHR